MRPAVTDIVKTHFVIHDSLTMSRIHDSQVFKTKIHYSF